MDFGWAVDGVTDTVPRTTGPECMNYMTNRRRWVEAVIFTLILVYIMCWAVKSLKPIVVPPPSEVNRPHSPVRLMLLLAMTMVFGIEMGFKLAEKSVIFVLNPCHIQTIVQIYLLAARPSKTTIALFRIQMNNLNGPLLAFLFPEVECRTMPFEEATYWIQHALLYIIPVYILKTGAYEAEDINDFNWVTIGVTFMLIYHFVPLNILSIYTGINLNHMLCAALADPFQGQNYRIAAVIHQSILCPILNKATVLMFAKPRSGAKEKKRDGVTGRQAANSAHAEERLYHQQSPPQSMQPQMQHEYADLQPAAAARQRASEEMSLAAEMAAAMGQPIGAMLTHRQHKHSSSYNGVEPIYDGNELLADGVLEAAEYPMPTTKID